MWFFDSLILTTGCSTWHVAEDKLAKSMNYWSHVLWSDESKVNLFDHPKRTAETTTVMLLKVKVMEWPSMSPDLNPIEHMCGILKRKVEKHHVYNIQQLCDVIMEEWKRMPATTCAALVISMPRRIKAVLDNNGAPTKWQFVQIDTLDTVLTCSLVFVASYLDKNGYMLSYI